MTINPPIVCDGCKNSAVAINVPRQQTYLVCGLCANKPCHELDKCPIHLDISIRE